jgi:biotin-(acetyl-CoA carboxylase) ligase
MSQAPEALVLPPPYRHVALDGGCDVLATARERASAAGAGTLYCGRRQGVLALAVVLEPETPLAEARLAHYAGMSALAEALAACCPPERDVRIRWPDGLLFDAARIGGGTTLVPEGTAEAAVPEWLVFGAELIADREGIGEPGRFAESTSLAEEEIGPESAILESFASHLMLNFDIWANRSLGAMLTKCAGRFATEPGRQCRIDRNGDLLEGGADNLVVRRALQPALVAMAWRDPVRGGPRL